MDQSSSPHLAYGWIKHGWASRIRPLKNHWLRCPPHLYSRMRSRRDFVVGLTGLHPLTTPEAINPNVGRWTKWGTTVVFWYLIGTKKVGKNWDTKNTNIKKKWKNTNQFFFGISVVFLLFILKHRSVFLYLSCFFFYSQNEVNPKIWAKRWYRWRSTWQIHHIKVFPGRICSVEGNCLFLWLVAYGSCDATSAAEQEIVVECCSSYAAWLTYTSSNSKVHESNIFVERLHAVPPHARIHGNWLCKFFTNIPRDFYIKKLGDKCLAFTTKTNCHTKYHLVN